MNTETLTISGAAHVAIPAARDNQPYLLFSDGESLNVIYSAKEDLLVAKQIYSISGATASDLPLKLDRKCFRTLGYAAFEDELLNVNQMQAVRHLSLYLNNYSISDFNIYNDQDLPGIETELFVQSNLLTNAYSENFHQS